MFSIEELVEKLEIEAFVYLAFDAKLKIKSLAFRWLFVS